MKSYKLWKCDTTKNTECPKNNCHINGGDCKHTSNSKYAMSPLHVMLDTQKAFQERVDPRCLSEDPQERAAFIRDHFTHCVQELGEMLQEVPYYKRWKDYSKMSKKDLDEAQAKTQEELIDAWHFFMNIMIAVGLDADSLYDAYLEKHKENIRRQDEGYDHTMRGVR